MEVADCCGSQYSTWKAVSCLEASAEFTTDKLFEHSLTILSHFLIHEKLYFVALWTKLKVERFSRGSVRDVDVYEAEQGRSMQPSGLHPGCDDTEHSPLCRITLVNSMHLCRITLINPMHNPATSLCKQTWATAARVSDVDACMILV